MTEYIAYKKAEIKLQLIDQNLSVSELEQRVAKEMSVNDETTIQKLKQIAQTYESKKEHIMKHNDGIGINVITEAKLNLHKEKYGVMSNKDLNENYYRDLQVFNQEEQEYLRKREKINEENKEIHRRKMQLIEQDEKDVYYDRASSQNDRNYTKRRHLRMNQLKRDLQYYIEQGKRVDLYDFGVL